MSGNVREWTNDYYGERYYSESPKLNPSGPNNGERRVVRGGSCKSGKDGLLVFQRGNDSQSSSERDVGFRLVLQVK